jgi:pilus assembly protein CpaE
MRLVVAQERSQLRDLPRQAALSLGLDCAPDDNVSYDELPVRLARGFADVVLVVLGDAAERGYAAIQHATALGLPVLAVGPAHLPQVILQSLRSGARVYLDETHVVDELSIALTQLSQTGEVIDDRRGQVHAVAAARNGLGVTTVATSVAFALGEKYPGRVVLAEIGTGPASLALNLDLEPTYTVADLARQSERLDQRLLQQALIEHPQGVHVLAQAPEALTVEPMRPAALRAILVLLKARFDFVVLDAGRATESAFLQGLNLIDRLLIVTRLDVPVLRLTRRYLQLLLSRDYPREKLHLVANRTGQRQQVAWREAEEALTMKIAHYIPDDPGTMNHSLNSGMPLVHTARRAAITRRFSQLAIHLKGVK